MPLLGIVNGSVREFLLKNYFGDEIANRVSVFSLIILIFIYGLVVRKKINIVSRLDAVSCSMIWIVLTLCFEFGFGHFVFDKSFETLLADYNVLEGRLWPLVLIFTGLLPFIVRKLTSTT